MPKFNPSTVLLDINDKPLRFGEVDAATKGRARALELQIAKATDEKNHEQAVRLRHELADLEETGIPVATLGSIAMRALLTQLPKGDDPREPEVLSEGAHLDHTDWAMKIRRAELQGETVEFDNETWSKIWRRITKAFRSSELIWRYKHELQDAEGDAGRAAEQAITTRSAAKRRGQAA